MPKNRRIVIVDALRGFALLLIVLIHYVEHFDFFRSPDVHFLFSSATDENVMEAVFFLISGKAYSIFALLFGFSFFIQISRKEEVGIDFRGRFVWRLVILLMMGFIHSLFYKGDILHIYAMLGFLLVFMYNVNTKALWALSIILVLQIPLIYNLVLSFIQPGFEYARSFGSSYWAEGNQTYATGNLYDVMSYNLWKGRAGVWGWTYYNGRYLQLITLFIVGLIMGRKRIFENISQYRKQLWYTLGGGALLVGLFYGMNGIIAQSELTGTQKDLATTLITSYANLAFTAAVVALVVLAYLRFSEASVFTYLSAYGRMSLTNYVGQAMFGVIFFYGFGLGMYRYLGSTWSVMLGGLVFITQAFISRYWAQKYHYGPLEWLWRSLTFWDFRTNVRKGVVEPSTVRS